MSSFFVRLIDVIFCINVLVAAFLLNYLFMKNLIEILSLVWSHRKIVSPSVTATEKHLVFFSFFSFQAAYLTVPFYWAAVIRVLPKAVRSDRVDFSTEH
jgi:hypothetical protein